MTPNGRYEARAIEAFLGETANGIDQLEIQWEIIGGPEEGSLVASQHYFTGKAKPITLDLMRHLGWTEGADLDSMRGNCSITLYEEEYKGELRQRVRAYVPNSGGLMMPANRRKNAVQAKSFLSRLTAAQGEDTFSGIDDEPRAGETHPVDDDSIPF